MTLIRRAPIPLLRQCAWSSHARHRARHRRPGAAHAGPGRQGHHRRGDARCARRWRGIMRRHRRAESANPRFVRFTDTRRRLFRSRHGFHRSRRAPRSPRCSARRAAVDARTLPMRIFWAWRKWSPIPPARPRNASAPSQARCTSPPFESRYAFGGTPIVAILGHRLHEFLSRTLAVLAVHRGVHFQQRCRGATTSPSKEPVKLVVKVQSERQNFFAATLQDHG